MEEDFSIVCGFSVANNTTEADACMGVNNVSSINIDDDSYSAAAATASMLSIRI
jgi:hypothetical protein